MLRFHRWPIWTLGAQRGVMVGSPRRLKASLEPSRKGLSPNTEEAGPAVQSEEDKERPHLP